MMMTKAYPSEREKISFSLKGNRDIDDRELSICQLREGMRSEWPTIYLETFKVDTIVYFNKFVLCRNCCSIRTSMNIFPYHSI